jgi:hypothetical protein
MATNKKERKREDSEGLKTLLEQTVHTRPRHLHAGTTRAALGQTTSNVLDLKLESTLHAILRVVDIERVDAEIALPNRKGFGKARASSFGPEVSLQPVGAVRSKE